MNTRRCGNRFPEDVTGGFPWPPLRQCRNGVSACRWRCGAPAAFFFVGDAAPPPRFYAHRWRCGAPAAFLITARLVVLAGKDGFLSAVLLLRGYDYKRVNSGLPFWVKRYSYSPMLLSRLPAPTLDSRIAEVRPPAAGWIRFVREGLGLSRQAVAGRLNVTQAAVRDYEESEAREAISLATLRRVADALGCEVVVALVPRQPGFVEKLPERKPRLVGAGAAGASPPAPYFGSTGDELEPHLR
jgi:transcriptional regulator with XRE-family HTH domain